MSFKQYVANGAGRKVFNGLTLGADQGSLSGALCDQMGTPSRINLAYDAESGMIAVSPAGEDGALRIHRRRGGTAGIFASRAASGQLGFPLGRYRLVRWLNAEAIFEYCGPTNYGARKGAKP